MTFTISDEILDELIGDAKTQAYLLVLMAYSKSHRSG
jgi:hypothetical protein